MLQSIIPKLKIKEFLAQPSVFSVLSVVNLLRIPENTKNTEDQITNLSIPSLSN